MSNLALYRKYRPQNFSEVLGQDHVIKVLEDSIEKNKISHAYLFVGSRGTGKTSVARILAKQLQISQNDTYEIDAASNRGIEDMKSLRENINFLPLDSKYKIYIIDEVHMLSKDAWGALLKTLEEPPRHVIFVLITTELQKVPETIISRCQVFTFKKPLDLILKNRILDLAKKENFELDNESAELIAILGDGSFRDAEGVLQKVLNFFQIQELDAENLSAEPSGKKKTLQQTQKKITKKEIEEITGAPKNILVNNFLSAIVENKLNEGILTIQKTVSENLDMKLYLKLIIQKLRYAIILKYAPNLENECTNISQEDLNFIKSLIKEDKTAKLRSPTLLILLEAYQNIENAFIAELPLELALIQILEQDKK